MGDDLLHSPGYLLLSVQRALLGAVSPALRAVTAETRATEVRLRFVFDGPIDEGDLEAARIAGTEVIADYPSPWIINDEMVRLDHPADVREGALQHWVYLRKEATAI
jgi:hypothetical protein